MKLPAIVVFLMALSACSAMPLPVPTAPRPQPAAAMVPCQPLSPLLGPMASDLARWVADTSEIYADCRANHQRLMEWIRNDR